MTTFDQSTENPLEFAYVAARMLTFPSDQIHSLRQVAARYARSGTPEGMARSLAVLEEARQLHLRLVNETGPDVAQEYPSFAVDFDLAGKHDRALVIIDDSVQMAERLRQKPRICVKIMIADACRTIGEMDRCRELLEEIRWYYQDRKRRLSQEDGPFDVLHSLYLKLGDVHAAKTLVSKLKGVFKANALVELAFYQKPYMRCGESELHSVHLFCKRYGVEYPLARIAELMTRTGLYLRGKCAYLPRIKTPAIALEGTLDVLVALLETGNTSDGLKLLQTLCTSATTFFYYQQERVQRLVSLLLPEHRDVAKLLLDRVLDEANKVNAFRDRFLRYTQYAGLVVPYSRLKAEEMVDLVLAHPVTDLGHRGNGPKLFFNRTGVCIMYELAMVVNEHGLRWDEDRKVLFRNYMAVIRGTEAEIGCAA